MAFPASTSYRSFNAWKFLGVFALVFLALVGGWAWFFWGRAQAAQDYARATLAAAASRDFATNAAPSCSEVTGQPLPGGVEACTYFSSANEVELKLQGGRRARISPHRNARVAAP